ncbi:hypothetical protein Slin15195_G053850 [Septoria linicola]|uniref:DUF7587 domain-containing protein n=1 Tax=Septoria linicola TaxID=215465 RepID=A0A9Q9EHQ8_9PEZI|nr:hypothetical protein Slin15195_G053850 [Septoria linicola]
MAPTRQTPGASGNGRRRGRRGMTWTRAMKEYLHVLNEEYPGSKFDHPQRRLNVFRAKFGAHAAACGVTGGITASMLGAQYYERNKTPAHVDWRVICSENLSPQQAAQRETVRSDILRLADSANSPAMLAAPTHPRPFRIEDTIREDSESDELGNAPSCHTRTRRTGQAAATTVPLIDLDSDGDTDEEWTPATPRSMDDNIVIAQSPTSTSGNNSRRGSGLSRQPRDAQEHFARYLYTRAADEHRRTDRMQSQMTTPMRVNKGRRPAHGPLKLSEAQIQKANMPYTPVKALEAHASPGALLYRYHTISPDQAAVNESGFTSRWHQMYPQTFPYPPACDMLDWDELIHHIQREEIPTHYISLSNNFFWICKRAFKLFHASAQKGVANMHISVIATDRLDRRALYHVAPYNRLIKRGRLYTDGAWEYGGEHEWLAYGRVPAWSILHTFSVADLLRQTFNSIRAKSLLSYETLVQSRAKQVETSRHTRQLTSASISCIAQLCHYVGVTAGSKSEQIAAILTDILRGWHFDIQATDWKHLETHFTNELLKCQDGTSIKQAFRSGLVWASGSRSVANPWHRPEDVRNLRKRAQKFGLGPPEQDLYGRLHDAGRSIGPLADLQIRLELSEGPERAPRTAIAPQRHRQDNEEDYYSHDKHDMNDEEEEEGEDDDDEDTASIVELRQRWRISQ